jgi:hypothetical protein
MFDRIIKLFENAKSEVLAFLSSYTLLLTTDMEIIQAPKRAARDRGVKLWYITEITRENLPFCKKQMKMVDDLRHLDGVRGNFIMSEREFIASPDISPQSPISEGFYSDVDHVLKLQRYMFNIFRNYAIPAETRIRQLESTRELAVRPPPSVIEKGKKTKVIDRLYVCNECKSIFIFREDAEEHQRASSHRKMNEFPLFD